MPFDVSRFTEAFGRHGMMLTASFTIDGKTFDALVGFTEPQTLETAAGFIDTGYLIESDDVRLAALKLDCVVVINGETYLVSQPPVKDRLGVFRKAELRKA